MLTEEFSTTDSTRLHKESKFQPTSSSYSGFIPLNVELRIEFSTVRRAWCMHVQNIRIFCPPWYHGYT